MGPTSTPWNRITNILWSHFVDGESVWTSILWFGSHFLTNFDSLFWISTWYESNSLVNIDFCSCSTWVQINHLPKSHIIVGQDCWRKWLSNYFENWTLDGDNFFNKTIHSIILLLGHIREVIGGFLQDPCYFDWVVTLGPIRPPPEPPPWGSLPSLSICFMYLHIHDALRTIHEISVRESLLT